MQQATVSEALRARFAEYAAIIERNAQMFQSTWPLEILGDWFNAYPNESKIYAEFTHDAATPPAKTLVK